MQQKAMKLMASKLAVAGIIEGNFTEEGLAAMSDVKDMTSQMAKELMMGIKDNVEDIASSFKRMAIMNRKEQPEADALPSLEVAENPTSELVEIPQSEIDALLAEMELTPKTVSDMTPAPVETTRPIEIETEPATDMTVEDILETPKPAAQKAVKPEPAAQKKRKAQNTTSGNAAQLTLIPEQEPKKSKRRKKDEVDENQLSLFDLAA